MADGEGPVLPPDKNQNQNLNQIQIRTLIKT